MGLFDGLQHVLRALRARGGWTLREVEEKTGGEVSYRSVQSYESGEASPPLDRLEVLLTFYGVRTFGDLEREFAPLRRADTLEVHERVQPYVAEDLLRLVDGLSPERAAMAAAVLEALRRMEEPGADPREREKPQPKERGPKR